MRGLGYAGMLGALLLMGASVAVADQTIRESAREIPLAYDVDVVVVGGSTRGVAAALYRCGDHERLGEKILRTYARDLRGHYATHAKAVLSHAVRQER